MIILHCAAQYRGNRSNYQDSHSVLKELLKHSLVSLEEYISRRAADELISFNQQN